MHKLISFSIKYCALVSIALAVVAVRASAQPIPPTSTIRVTGEASVESRPDRVLLDFGVRTRADTAQQAATENARIAQNVIAALRRVIGQNDTVETISYSLQPEYRFPENAPPMITGYVATNIVRVTKNDLANIGVVMDTAIQSGANVVELIRFTVRDESAAKARALRMAAADAHAKARSLANGLGLQITRIYSVEESSVTPRPLFELRAQATTPIIPRTVETTATVTLMVQFRP
jgi:hypothetical protein